METLSGSKPRLFFMGLFCNGPVSLYLVYFTYAARAETMDSYTASEFSHMTMTTVPSSRVSSLAFFAISYWSAR